MTTATGSSSNRFRFAGGEFVDVGTEGLYYFRNRYYDPELMRWISEDPIGLAGGVNWYAYVGNDPVNYADPWGLAEGCEEWGLDSGGYLVCKRWSHEGILVSVPREIDDPSAGAGPGSIHFPFSPGGSSPNRNNTCRAAALEMFARTSFDAALTASLVVPVGHLGRGLLLVSRGQAISSGLILTTTLKGAGSTGAGETMLGGAYLSAGAAGVGARASAVPPGLSLLPRNAYDFWKNGGLDVCR